MPESRLSGQALPSGCVFSQRLHKPMPSNAHWWLKLLLAGSGFPFKLGQFGCRSLSGVEANPAACFDSAQPTAPLSQRLLSPALSE